MVTYGVGCLPRKCCELLEDGSNHGDYVYDSGQMINGKRRLC